jgi:hypothetical protein
LIPERHRIERQHQVTADPRLPAGNPGIFTQAADALVDLAW